MKILFVSSEVSPFAKTGGLADVAGALPKALRNNGHDVRIIMPLYHCVETGNFTIKKARKGFEVPVDGTMQKGLLRQTSLGDIPVYLVENKEYFQRPALYGTPAGDYPDNSQRFGFFCQGVIDLLKRLDFRPDIIHCHDWQTALIPFIIRYEHKDDPFFARTALVYTIHNLAYQGIFEREALNSFGLDESHFTVDRLEYYGKINLMKGGILTADVINTVSNAYCREVQTKEFGCGLQGVLQQRVRDFYGILNGIDYEDWNPSTDPLIFKNYTPTALSGKAANKKSLQKALGLEQSPTTPLLGMVTRLSSQKGLDLLEALLPKLQKEKLQLVLLGTGDEKYMKFFSALQEKPSDALSINLTFNLELSHKIYAASDIFLMPSLYEPCGLGQLIAFRYGSVPVVRKTGGLADTVFDLRDGVREANGFTFEEYTPEAFWQAISRALETYKDRKKWDKMVRIGMNTDYSWDHSAEEYEMLYEKALQNIHV
ncbi:MAG: glycogen synthase GlgA [Geobacteraceae bacterium]